MNVIFLSFRFLKHAKKEKPVVGRKAEEISKTKEVNKILIKFDAKNSLLIVDKKSKENIEKATRNIPNVKITVVGQFSAFDLAKYKKVIFTESSIKELEKRYQ